MRIREERKNRAIVWDNYKAGVINVKTGEVIVPIRYDEIEWRIRSFRSPGPGVPPPPCEVVGFACFTDDGEAVAYDINGNVDDWMDWEADRLHLTPDPLPERSLEDIEKEFFEKYYEGKADEELKELLRLRLTILNHDWKHTPENAKLISGVNERVNAAVREALRLGEEAEKLVKASGRDWSVDVEVYPEWDDEEMKNDSVDSPECIQNIIAELGRAPGYKSISPFFTWGTCAKSDINSWDFKTAAMDDGVSWDEGAFRRPAYMDCYFLRPFQELFFDNYLFAISDLLSIKDFRVNVLVNTAVER